MRAYKVTTDQGVIVVCASSHYGAQEVAVLTGYNVIIKVEVL